MAKGSVGHLNVLVGASIGGLRSGLKGGVKLVAGFATSVKGTLGGIGGLLTGFGLSAVGLTAGLKSAAASIDATAKTADRLGISIEGFVGLKHAATLASVPVEALAFGITKMEDNLATAAKQGGPVEKVLNDMGLRSKDLINLKPDEAFGKIADGIMSIENPSQRTAAAIDVFGKSGAMLIPLLKEGSAGFARATAEAKRFGLVFTPAEAANVDAFGDAFDKVGEAIKGGFMRSLIQIAPHLTNLVEQASFTFADIGTSVGKFVGKAVTNISFMAKNWDLHWELMTTSTAIQLNRLQALTKGAFAAIEEMLDTFSGHWTTVLADLGNKLTKSKEGLSVGGGWKLKVDTKKAGSDIRSFWEGIKNIGNASEVIPGQDPNATFTRYKGPMRLFQEGFKKSQADIAAGLPGVIKSNAEVAGKLWEGVGNKFNEVMADSTDMALQGKLKELGEQLTKARMEFEKGIVNAKPQAKGNKAGAGAFSGLKATGISSHLAGAAQIGTTEAASQITASMTAFNKKDDQIEKNTGLTVTKLEEIKNAISKNAVPDFDMIPAF